MTATTEKSSPKKKGGNDKTNEEKINEIIAEGGSVIKMEVDYSSTCDEKIPQAQELAAKGKLTEALDMLMSLEKQTRTGSDMHSTARVLVTIVQLCFNAEKWELLNENIIVLTKKRSQLKQAVAKMVAESCTYLDKTPDKETQLKLINTLRSVTEGKIYVEVERARLTHRLSKIYEADGKVSEAAKVMQELQVETYGSMERKEKVELILEQMRLCLATQDYIRTQIISKKISTRFFEDGKNQELKLTFYQLMIEMCQHEGSYLEICKHWRAIYDTALTQDDVEKKLFALKNVVLYVVLAKYDNEQSDLIHRIMKEKALDDILKYKNVMEQFTTPELISQTRFCELFEKEIRNGVEGSTATAVFARDEAGEKRWNDLKKRIVEHNIRIMAKYYTRIRLVRMSELLALSQSETEDSLSEMVVAGTVSAKTDRLEGIVDFSEADKDPLETLNEWSSNISSLMGHVMKTTHLINKEEMVHKAMAGISQE